MKQVCLYIVGILLITASCTHQDEPMSAITENDSVPLSINSVSLPEVEVGTRNGNIWQANDKYIGLALYVYPTNGYAERLVYYQYDELQKTWGALNGEKIYLGNAGAKLLIVYPVTLRSSYAFNLLPDTYDLANFKFRLEGSLGYGYYCYTDYYHMDWDWRNSGSHYDKFASYDVISGVNRTNPYININLKQVYAGFKVCLRTEDTNIRYFRNLKIYNTTSGVPYEVRFNFFTQTYAKLRMTTNDVATTWFKINDSDIIDGDSNWAATFFVAPNIEKGVTKPITGILYISITAHNASGLEETRIVELDLSDTRYKNLATFTPGKEHVITLTWK